jgi:hypothetical protein
MSVWPMNMVTPTPMPVSGSASRMRGSMAGVPVGCPAAQLAPSVQVNEP